MSARREPFDAGSGLMYARYRKDDATVYFIVNMSDAAMRGRDFRPAAKCAAAWTMDPMDGRIAAVSVDGGKVRLSLESRHSVLLYVKADCGAKNVTRESDGKDGKSFEVNGAWTLAPVAGGPEPMPPVRLMERLSGWERNADGSENPFCGTMRYETSFDAPYAGAAIIDLGDVRQSAHVVLNGVDLGKAFFPPFRLRVPAGTLREKGNRLVIEVTSVAANRIRQMDKDGVEWRIFHDINFASYGGGMFDASDWPLTVNGLLGPVVFHEDRGI